MIIDQLGQVEKTDYIWNPKNHCFPEHSSSHPQFFQPSWVNKYFPGFLLIRKSLCMKTSSVFLIYQKYNPYNFDMLFLIFDIVSIL